MTRRERTDGIPPEGRTAFYNHKSSAKQRGVAFLFTIEEWWAWWQEDGRWRHRGRRAHQLCMCRKGDQGPYAPGNVYCGTNAENLDKATGADPSGYSRAIWARLRAAGIESHLKDRAFHPKNRPVVTPDGFFPSAALAGERYGLTRQAIAHRCSKRTHGFYWADTEPAPAPRPRLRLGLSDKKAARTPFDLYVDEDGPWAVPPETA